MSKFVYVSTDARETQAILEPGIARSIPDFDRNPMPGTKYTYHILEEACYGRLEKEIGFPPYTSIEFPDSANDKNIGNVVKVLLGNDLFVAVDSGSGPESFRPKDFGDKTWVLENYLRRLNCKSFQPSY